MTEMPWARDATAILNSFLSGGFPERAETLERLKELIGAAYHTGHTAGRASMRDEAARVADAPPSGIAPHQIAAATITALRKENERLRARGEELGGIVEEQIILRRAAEAKLEKAASALRQLVVDYQDVPDPTDADGQAVFEDARSTLTEIGE